MLDIESLLFYRRNRQTETADRLVTKYSGWEYASARM